MPEELKAWAFTFGVQYGYEPHPDTVQGVIPNPEGWVTIMAASEGEARLEMYSHCQRRWAFSYPLDRFDHSLYPEGELIRITAGENPGPYTLE